jgi:hypothetical protein
MSTGTKTGEGSAVVAGRQHHAIDPAPPERQIGRLKPGKLLGLAAIDDLDAAMHPGIGPHPVKIPAQNRDADAAGEADPQGVR